MTSWLNKDNWHRWLDETGHVFDIAAFYDEDGDQARFPVVQAALWLEMQPDAMQSFLARFKPDGDDVALARAELSKAHDAAAHAILQRWIGDDE